MFRDLADHIEQADVVTPKNGAVGYVVEVGRFGPRCIGTVEDTPQYEERIRDILAQREGRTANDRME